jgi:hypothetical protein
MTRFSKLIKFIWKTRTGPTSPIPETLCEEETYVNRFGERRTLKVVRDMKYSFMVCVQTGFAYSNETRKGVANVFYDVMPHNEDLVGKVG